MNIYKILEKNLWILTGDDVRDLDQVYVYAILIKYPGFTTPEFSPHGNTNSLNILTKYLPYKLFSKENIPPELCF